ncbi:MAG: alpha/beta fold hydrolase [Pseudorhizobium pelagicum]|uniref:alpha/beta hydrolase n=1 Tax=Pseudorhizobium pelagicum TaxID=1509405 RepID=UPI00345FBF69
MGGASNPDRSFAVIRRRQLPEAAFTELAATHAKAKGSLGVFVHGYNYTLAEAVFRLAQLGADNEAFPVSVLFSWPSKGTVTGYLADRDAATYARDDLVHVLDLLSNVKTEEKISLVAHSMGGWLVMEALRQLRLEGRSNVIDRFRVGLAAPDIDIDVFRSQMVSIGQLTPPLHLLVSTDDRALAASQRLAGGRLRVGSVDVRDPNLQEIAQREGITIIDVSSLKARDLAKHDRFVQFAAVGTVWPPDRMKATDQLGRSGVFVFRKSTVAAPRRQ